MQTLLVEIKDITGLRILQELEQAHIIRLIQPAPEKTPKSFLKDYAEPFQRKLPSK